MVSGDPRADSLSGRLDGPGPSGSLGGDARRAALVESLRSRYRSAEERSDADAKRALFKEAVYLGIQPDEFTLEG